MSALSTAAARPAARQPAWLAWLLATPLRRAMALTVSWRMVIGAWGVFAHGLVAKGPYAADTLMHHGWERNPFTLLIDSGVRMDGFWYAGIAQHGYGYHAGKLTSIAYFPLYPILIKGVSLLTGDVYLAGMLISTLSLFVAVWALQVWLGDRGLATSSTLAAGLLLCFPVAFFWASMYTESLFLALALGAFVLYERQRWLLSAVCVFLAVLTRPTGLILAPCLGLMAMAGVSSFKFQVSGFKWWWRRESATGPTSPKGQDTVPERVGAGLANRGSSLVRFLPVLAGPLAYGGFAAYQWVVFGNPLATIKADQAPPFSRNLAEGLSDLILRRPGFPSWYLAGLLALGLVFLAAVPLVYRRFGAPYALFAALAVLFPMSTGLVSLERYVLIDFPVFAAVALTKSRLIPVSLMAAGFYLSLGLMALFIAGYTII